MQEATTGDGRPAPTAYAALLLAAERGYTHELFLRESGFFVTLRHADTMPDARIDAFLVVRDGGAPFCSASCAKASGSSWCSIATSPAASRASCATPIAWKSSSAPPAPSGAMRSRCSVRSTEDPV